MNDFLDRAEEIHRTGRAGQADEAFGNVQTALTELQSVYAKAYLDPDNIEVLFGAVEMGSLLGKFGKRTSDEVRSLRTSLERLIVTTLEQTVRFPFPNHVVHPPAPYDQLSSALSVRLRQGVLDTAFITFNYDICLDVALHKAGGLNYCLDGDGIGFPLLKLHGSINWGRCSVCPKIVPFDISKASNFARKAQDAYARLTPGTQIGEVVCPGCRTTVSGPVLVPPTLNKSAHHELVASVWRRACRELGEAENVVVVGYSMPRTDEFFRYLFALGTEGPTRIKRFWVIDPDPDGEVEKRYRELVGRGIERRFKFFRTGFESSVNLIQQVLESSA